MYRVLRVELMRSSTRVTPVLYKFLSFGIQKMPSEKRQKRLSPRGRRLEQDDLKDAPDQTGAGSNDVMAHAHR